MDDGLDLRLAPPHPRRNTFWFTHDRNVPSTARIVARTPPIAAMETLNLVVSLMAGLRLQSQFAVRPKTDEFEDIGAALAVDEYEIGPEVAVAAALPGPG